MTDTKTSWRALIQTAEATVQGQTFKHRKQGTLPTIALLAEDDVLGGVVKELGNRQVEGGQLDAASVKAAVESFSKESGIPVGTIAVRVAQALPKVLGDLVVRAAVIPDDEKADFREWVETWGWDDCLNFLVSFVGLNFPRYRGPFVSWAARGKMFLAGLLSRLETSLPTDEPSESGASSEPSSDTAPAAA